MKNFRISTCNFNEQSQHSKYAYEALRHENRSIVNSLLAKSKLRLLIDIEEYQLKVKIEWTHDGFFNLLTNPDIINSIVCQSTHEQFRQLNYSLQKASNWKSVLEDPIKYIRSNLQCADPIDIDPFWYLIIWQRLFSIFLKHIDDFASNSADSKPITILF